MSGAAHRRRHDRRRRPGAVYALAALALAGALAAAALAWAGMRGGPEQPAQPRTTTPIKHLIVVLGENHSFDNVFATYRPRAGQRVWNLRSQGIVHADGRPGPNVGRARQWKAATMRRYSTGPRLTTPYRTLPRPNTGNVPSECDGGQAQKTDDRRFPADLPNAPYQITRYVSYLDDHGGAPGCMRGAYVGDPIHRFYQMWQQQNEGRNRLWVWTAETAGLTMTAPPPWSTHQGALSVGFYNVAQGDAPVLKYLADHFAMSDNFHQAVMGGSGTNHIAVGAGDAASYGRDGRPATPPKGEIDDPDPRPGTDNAYLHDGPHRGNYSACADRSQPGVPGIMERLEALPYRAFRGGDCAPSTSYLLNHSNPAYAADGTPSREPFTVPPQSFPTLADALSAKGVPWAFYGEGWRDGTPDEENYCRICNPFQYATSVMRDPAKRSHLTGFADFEHDVAAGTLPAFSIVEPSSRDDGHPVFSTLAAFESFLARVVDDVARRPHLLASTAIVITMDEGGGYYDSGYVQPLHFFGDGPRIPAIVVSPYTRPGRIDHTYTDLVSILKFAERNWDLAPLSARSWDNLPNPTTGAYVPANRPAIGDLTTLFDFNRPPRDAKAMAARLERTLARD
jgi:acid phosphatase